MDSSAREVIGLKHDGNMYFIASRQTNRKKCDNFRRRRGVSFGRGQWLEVAYGEFLIVRWPENSAVKVPEDGLRKKASLGSCEPTGLFGAFAAIRSVALSRQGYKRWIEEQPGGPSLKIGRGGVVHENENLNCICFGGFGRSLRTYGVDSGRFAQSQCERLGSGGSAA
jgi:hypothetical protein